MENNERIQRIIEIEKQEKSGILDFYNCTLENWPEEIFEMSWISVLNFCPKFIWTENGMISEGSDKNGKIKIIHPKILQLTNLKVLCLAFNEIQKIENLQHNIFIKELFLGDNRIRKIENLEKLVNLQKLYLSDNQIRKIECLNTLTELNTLALSFNQFQKIENLEKLINLQQLYLTGNTIIKIENLEKLTKLRRVDVAMNQIQKIENLDRLNQLEFLNLSSNQIKKIENLDKLYQIESLNISNNQIKKIENLDKLIKIKSIYLHSNQIKKIENIEKLTNVENLVLSFNQIKKIENVEKLVNLKYLDLSKNQIKKIENLDNLTHLIYLDLTVNAIENITPEELAAFKYEAKKIIARVNEINKETLIEIYLPCKIILLGNSEDGKTTICKYIIDDNKQFTKVDDKSTHGLKIRPWIQNEVLKALLYDFGGQDYYHAVYNMFLSSHAIYLLLWDNKRKYNFFWQFNKEGKQLSKNDQYYAFCPEYWLSNIHFYLAQNKSNSKDEDEGSSKNRDEDKISISTIHNMWSEKVTYLELSDKADIPEIDYQYNFSLDVENTSELNHKKIEIFKLTLEQDVKKLKRNLKVKDKDYKLISDIISKVGNKENAFKTLDVKSFTDNISNQSDIYLKTLHLMGFILYYPDIPSLKDYYWIDPSTVSEKIYDYLKENRNSRIDKSSIKKEDEILIELMKEQEIIFLDPEENKYIVPQYLEPVVNDPLFGLASIDIHQGFYIQFGHFLPHGLMSRLMCRFGTKENLKHFYKNDLVFSEQVGDDIGSSIRVRIKLDPVKLKLSIYIKFPEAHENKKELYYKYIFQSILAAYWNEEHVDFNEWIRINSLRNHENLKGSRIDENEIKHLFQEHYVWDQLFFEKFVPADLKISLDNNHFISYEELRTHDYEKNIKIKRLPIITVNVKNEINSEDKNEENPEYIHKKIEIKRSLFDPFVQNKSDKVISVFISYSHDDLNYRKELQKFLINLEREHKIEIWQDGEISAGMDWDKTIKANIEKADIFIMLVSQNFIKSNYVHFTEMKMAFQQLDSGKTKIMPILLSDCDWEEWNVYGEDISEDKRSGGRVGNYQFLPMDVENDEDKKNDARIKPINQWDHPEVAWKQVVKHLREQ